VHSNAYVYALLKVPKDCRGRGFAISQREGILEVNGYDRIGKILLDDRHYPKHNVPKHHVILLVPCLLLLADFHLFVS